MDNANNTTTSNNTSYKSHLQHTYGRRTADIFHQCSKLIGKSSKSSCHISFLKCCRDFGLVPKGLRLKNPVSSDRSKAIVAKAESLLLTSELNGHKKSFSGYSKKIKSLLANLKTLTNDNEFESISRLNSIKANSIMLSAIRTHGRKFQQLLDDSSLHFDSLYITFLEYIERTPRSISPSIAGPLRDTKPHSKKKTTVVNMSNEHITNDELELFSLGLKFTQTPMNDPSTDIASRIQPTIRNLPNSMQSSIANYISHLLLNSPSKHDNLQPHQRRALKKSEGQETTSSYPSCPQRQCHSTVITRAIPL